LKHVTFLTEYDCDAPATGGVLRLHGLEQAVSTLGWAVTTVRTSTASSRNLFMRHLHLRSAARLAGELPAGTDVLHIDGLPLAHAAVGARQLGVPCLLDVCDSWTMRIGGYHLLTLERWLAQFAVDILMARAATAASRLIYISERDLVADRLRFSRLPPGVVVPNGIDEGLFAIPLRDPDMHMSGPATIFADLAYQPNADGLAWFVRNVWPLIPPGTTSVDIYGPTAPRFQLPTGIRYRGFVEDKSVPLSFASMALNPASEGSGLKNKVLEALAAGLPVVTTSEGAKGLSRADPGLLIADTADEFANAIRGVVSGKVAFDSARLRAIVEQMRWKTTGNALVRAYDSVTK